MDLIDALTRLVSALAGCAAAMVAARQLVDALARSRSVCADTPDTPTQRDDAGPTTPGAVHTG